jgi:hypothetical protein
MTEETLVALSPGDLPATQTAIAEWCGEKIATLEREVVQNVAKGDPIMVGRLRDPVGNGRVVTFFIAWWMNLATL